MIQQKLYHPTGSINIVELRQIAILMHQLNVLDLEKSLWNTYLKAGTGILLSKESNLKVWPSSLKLMIQLDQRATTMSDVNQIKVDDDRCLKYVNDHRRELDKTQQQCQEQFNLKKKQFYGFTITTENILQTFIKEQIQSLRLKYECSIQLVEFDYREQVLEHALLQQNPNEQQVI
jgi:hypothetical protein